MAIYSVHSRIAETAALLDRADDVRFVRDGFSWPAFAFTWAWLAFKRMWIVLILFAAAQIALVALAQFPGLGPLALLPAAFAVNLLLGLEGANLQRWSLARRGYLEVATESGDTLEEAERRFFMNLPAPAVSAPAPYPMRYQGADPLGLFSPPGNV